MRVDKRPVEEEPEVPTITEIPEEKVPLEKGYYHVVYFMLHLNKEKGFERKEEQADVYQYSDEEEIEDVKLDYEKERQWKVVFEDNDGGVEDKKELLHAKRWDVYMNER